MARSEGWETDLSELATYLNDAVLVAPPRCCCGRSTSFAPVDDRSFDVTLVDAGLTVTARVTRGSAVWQLPEGPLAYLDFRMSAGAVRYNVAPTDIMLAYS